MAGVSLKAHIRTGLGKEAVKKLRRLARTLECAEGALGIDNQTRWV